MRLLGIALCVLVAMGLIQYSVSKTHGPAKVIARLSDDRIVHNLASSVPTDIVDKRDLHTYDFAVREQDTWNAISGSPGYQKIRFNLPIDARVEEGTLLLDLSTQLQDEAVAQVRVNINGNRRGEIILPDGQTKHRVRINLVPSDLTKSVLDVAISTEAQFPTLACSGGWNGGLIVRVEPTSRVKVATLEPLDSLSDRLRSTGDPMQVVWPDTNDTVHLGRIMQFALEQVQRGARTEFHLASDTRINAVDLDPLDLMTASAMSAPAMKTRNGEWPMKVVGRTRLGEAKFFESRTDWRIPYDLRDTPNAELPTHFDLYMSLVGVKEDDSWLLSVTLNGSAIHTERLKNPDARLSRTVELPRDLQEFSNLIEVRLISAEPQSSESCLSGAPVMAQLERGTQLRGGVPAIDSLPSDFINTLPETLDLVVAPNLNAAEATSAVSFLSDTFGTQRAWNPIVDPYAGGKGRVHVLSRGDVVPAAVTALTASDLAHWLVWPRAPGHSAGPYGLRRIKDAGEIAHLPFTDGARIVALVSLVDPNTAPQVSALKPDVSPPSPPSRRPLERTDITNGPVSLAGADANAPATLAQMSAPSESAAPAVPLADTRPQRLAELSNLETVRVPNLSQVVATTAIKGSEHHGFDVTPAMATRPSVSLSLDGTLERRSPAPLARAVPDTRDIHIPLHPAFLPAIDNAAITQPDALRSKTAGILTSLPTAIAGQVVRSLRPAPRPWSDNRIARQEAGEAEVARRIVTLSFKDQY